jgi:uncharacterized protein
MTRIAVFSDLHIPKSMKEFPYSKIEKYMNDIDLIFGLGDYVTQNAFDSLYGFGKPLYAVFGNMDECLLKQTLPNRLNLNIEKLKIGLIHGFGSPFRIKDRILKEFDNVDLICFGHTHYSFNGLFKGKHFFNPGALCSKKSSFGIIEIDDDKIKGKIII